MIVMTSVCSGYALAWWAETNAADMTQFSWAETAAELAGPTFMGTVPGIGTTPVRNLPLGLRTFLSQRDAGFTQVSGVLPQGNPGGLVQALVGPLPEGYSAGLPTVEYLAAVLHAGSPLVASILYEGSDYGHNVLITGIDWNGSGGVAAGTMKFVDPLDPAVYDEAGLPVAMKLTTGVFSILPSLTLTNPQTNVQDTLTNVLALDYQQYQGGLPYEPGNHAATRALIGGATVVQLPEPATFHLAATATLAAFGWTVLCRRKSGP